ncbi:MAG: hypothetical protein WBD30_00355, partial [Bacteroidota bacterium]
GCRGGSVVPNGVLKIVNIFQGFLSHHKYDPPEMFRLSIVIRNGVSFSISDLCKARLSRDAGIQ